jgi:hypothetical protein
MVANLQLRIPPIAGGGPGTSGLSGFVNIKRRGLPILAVSFNFLAQISTISSKEALSIGLRGNVLSGDARVVEGADGCADERKGGGDRGAFGLEAFGLPNWRAAIIDACVESALTFRRLLEVADVLGIVFEVVVIGLLEVVK